VRRQPVSRAEHPGARAPAHRRGRVRHVNAREVEIQLEQLRLLAIAGRAAPGLHQLAFVERPRAVRRHHGLQCLCARERRGRSVTGPPGISQRRRQAGARRTLERLLGEWRCPAVHGRLAYLLERARHGRTEHLLRTAQDRGLVTSPDPRGRTASPAATHVGFVMSVLRGNAHVWSSAGSARKRGHRQDSRWATHSCGNPSTSAIRNVVYSWAALNSLRARDALSDSCARMCACVRPRTARLTDARGGACRGQALR
jgi:hypothetical protein